MKKSLVYFLFVIFLYSCKSDDLQVTNEALNNEIKFLISEIKNNPPCKYDYLVVQITDSKIYISNNKPIITEYYIGKCDVDQTKVFFYSQADYSHFIKVNDNSKKNFYVDSDYSNSCHPQMDLILVIDKKNHSKFSRYIHSENISK